MIRYDGLIVFLGSLDLERTQRFYGETLGLPLHLDQGKCLIFRVPGGGMVGFCTHLETLPSTRAPIVTLLAQDVDQVHRALVEAGVETDGEPRLNKEFGIYHFFATDPDGHTVEVQRFLDSPE